MRKIMMAIFGVMMLIGVSALTAAPVSAEDTVCSDGAISEEMREMLGCAEDTTADEVVNTGLNLVLTATGIIAVGVMVYGGFVYLTSQGDPSKVKRGRDVILYGLVGLAVALLAFAIVAFVTNNLPSPS